MLKTYEQRTSTHDAPASVIEAVEHETQYTAVVSRRGGIKPQDYLALSQRFASLCNEVYGESDFQLLLDQGVSVDPESVVASQDEYLGDLGVSVTIDRIDPTAFTEIFTSASSLTLRIAPKQITEGLESSFAQVKWTRERPQVLGFYAQNGGNYDLPPSERPLQKLLTRRMFFVPESAPKRGLKVKLGLGEYSRSFFEPIRQHSHWAAKVALRGYLDR